MPKAGRSSPLGVTVAETGVNVAVVSRHATAIHFCLYDASGEEELYRFKLPHRLGDVHFGHVAGVAEGFRYGLRAEGPWNEAEGHYFDSAKLLVDPYAMELDRPFHHVPQLLERGTDTGALVPKAIIRKPQPVAQPLPPQRPQVIYELGVKSFTMRHPDVPPELRGKVLALATPAVIGHIASLGVDTVELMPLMAWIDERHLTGLGLANGWGYNPVVFGAPDPRLAPGGFADVRAAIEALHRAGIRVVLDVVLNHTGESDEGGTTLSLGGLDNALYYRMENGRLVNDTGCGNTLACDRAPVIQLVLDMLRRWAAETGLDGFRFDLATVLGKNPNAPLLAAIAQDPTLRDLILIAEPWDLSIYGLGRFPAPWLEWNDRYRDEVRRFWRGDRGAINALATRLAGSSDIFAPHRRPSASVNFIAAHDGFTLADVTRYAAKQNIANGEDNRDGNSNEPTWPGGDVRALLATLFLSRGTPMLTAGDEFGRTQHGNNNAYAQDNAITWLDWGKADRSLLGFVTGLIRLRQSHPLLSRDQFLIGTSNGTDVPDAQWLGADGAAMDWANPEARVIGLLLSDGHDRLGIWINGGAAPLQPVMAPRDGHRWRRIFCSAEGPDVPARAVALFAEEHLHSDGISDDTLRKLAAAAGIERDWWEVDGTHHEVPLDTLRHILQSLGLPHGNASEIHEARERLRHLPGLRVVRSDVAAVLAEAGERRREFRLRGEDGNERTITTKPGEPLTLSLPMGRYHMAADDGTTLTILAGPPSCYLPPEIAADHRVFGFAAHLYALRHGGDGGIGDFETLRRFAGMTVALGGRYAGINPLHHMFPSDRSRVSPYQPSDRRFIDPIYISIAQLLADHALPKTSRLADERRAAFAQLEKLPLVDYAAHWSAKRDLLESAFSEIANSPEIDALMAAEGPGLARHGAFEAQRAGEAPEAPRIRFRAFLELIARQQLARAAARSVLYRDLALGSAFDGGEIAGDPAAFIDTISLGAPPDPFAQNGQVWNLPAFSPLELARRGLEPMAAILRTNMRSAAALRIDHILGFARQFWVPRGAEGKAGAYVRFPMEALIALTAIESQRTRCLIVGEDLGTVPDGLRQALHDAAILSYRVLWFERQGTHFRDPTTYPARALCCLASHDLPTFSGWRKGRDIAIAEDLGSLTPAAAATRRAERQKEITALDQASGNGWNDEQDAAIAVHGFVARAPSAVMLIQADDLAGETEPLNVPGTDRERPNWRRRLAPTIDELAASAFTRNVVGRVKKERGNA